MKNDISNLQLDHIFRTAIRQLVIDFEEDTWLKLENTLHKVGKPLPLHNGERILTIVYKGRIK